MINLNLDIKEVEGILAHLGKGAYGEVAALVAKIHGQAIPQVQKIQAASEVAEVPAQVDAEQNVA